jgi:hypothetical protein
MYYNNKVGWLRADDQTILSLHRRVVTHNPRVSVTHDESRTWNLHIRQVKESDQGCYMCQVINWLFNVFTQNILSLILLTLPIQQFFYHVDLQIKLIIGYRKLIFIG